MHSSPSSLLAFSLLASSGVLADVKRATCTGAQQAGYCCNGSIFKKDDSNDISAANLICCEGDPHVQINFGANAPTSCTAGNEVPLTKASGGGSSQSTGSRGGSSGSGSSDSSSSASSSASPASDSSNNGARAMVTAAAIIGGIVLGL